MTGFARRRAISTACFCTIGTASRGKLDAQVAAGDHDRVERLDDLFEVVDGLRLLDLRDDRDAAADLVHDLVDAHDVFRVPHERQRDEVGTELEAPPAQIGFVLLGERGHVDRDTREVDALVVGHWTRDDDAGRHDRAVGLEHLDTDLAVVDQQEVPPGGDVVGEPLERRADELLRAEDVLGRDLEDVSDGELVRSVLELAEADLGPWRSTSTPIARPESLAALRTFW